MTRQNWLDQAIGQQGRTARLQRVGHQLLPDITLRGARRRQLVVPGMSEAAQRLVGVRTQDHQRRLDVGQAVTNLVHRLV